MFLYLQPVDEVGIKLILNCHWFWSNICEDNLVCCIFFLTRCENCRTFCTFWRFLKSRTCTRTFSDCYRIRFFQRFHQWIHQSVRPLAAELAIWADHSSQSVDDKVSRSEGMSHYGLIRPRPTIMTVARYIYTDISAYTIGTMIGNCCVPIKIAEVYFSF